MDIPIPVKNEKLAHGYEWQRYPIIYPHDYISFLFNTVKLHIGQASLTRYWVHSKATGQGWAVYGPPDNDQCIPLGLYGDCAKLTTIYKSEKLLCIWANLPLWRPKSTRASRWLIFSIMHDQLFKSHTIDTVMKHVLWSLEALYKGEIPQRGPFGNDLPKHMAGRAGEPITTSKHRFITTEYRGDWEWHRDLWHFANCSWLGKSVCWQCDAQAGGPHNNAYWNVEPNALWVNNEFTKAQFLARRQREKFLCN